MSDIMQIDHAPRRDFLQRAGLGCGSLALTSLLHQEVVVAAPASPTNPLVERATHFAPKAKAVIWLFQTGSPSQVDTFDYKPELAKRNGTELAGADPKTGFLTTSGKCLKSPFKLARPVRESSHHVPRDVATLCWREIDVGLKSTITTHHIKQAATTPESELRLIERRESSTSRETQ